MPKQRRIRRQTANEEVRIGTATVLVLSNGVLSALTGTWMPTLVAVGFITAASLYGMLTSHSRE